MSERFRFYTLWLAGICVIVFILQLIIPGFTEMLVLNNSAINNLEIWRFLSSIFLHGSIEHLLSNMVALMFFGFILEKLIGGKKFLLVFFVGGIIANVIAVNFYPSSLGASGAIMGIIGVLAVIRPFMMVWTIAPLPMIAAAVVYVVIDLFGVFYPMGVGNIAHLSGIAFGVIYGFILRSVYKDKFRVNRERKVYIPETYIRSWEDNFMR
jgi:membrane associated rhomboid family serine protease